MKFVKKLVLSLGIVVTLAIAFVVGITGKANSSAEPTAPNQAVQDENTKKPVKLNYEPGEVVFQRGGSVINYNYNPSVNSAEEEAVKPVAYEYMFGNTMDVATAVNLKSIDTTGVTVTYAYSYEGKLTDTDAVESVENYTLLPLENKGDTVYIYLIVVPEDAAIPVTFTTSVVWYYGIPQETPIIDNVTGQIIEKQTIVAGQAIDAKTLTLPKTTPASEYNGSTEYPYYFDAWYMDKNFTQLADGQVKAGQQLYARFANLPSTAIASDGASTVMGACDYGLPYNVVIPTGITNIVSGTFKFSRITSVSIPNTVTTIGGDAFFGCDITSLYIPASVTSISGGLYGENVPITSIIVDANNTVYDSRNDCNAIVETATDTLIQGCYTTTIPDDITAIKNGAFNYLYMPDSSLKLDLVIPNSVTSIGASAFGNSNATIDFSQCKQLANIGADAFVGCTLSGILDFSQIPVSQFDLAYSDEIYSSKAFTDAGGVLSKIIFPNGITNDHPLFNLSGMYRLSGLPVETLDLSNTALTAIPESCFFNSSVKDVIFPSTLQYFNAGAFSDCTNLQVVTIPASVISVNTEAFGACSSLHTVYNLSTADLTISGIDSTLTNIYTAINSATALQVYGQSRDNDAGCRGWVSAKEYLNGNETGARIGLETLFTQGDSAYFKQHTNPVNVGDVVSYVFQIKNENSNVDIIADISYSLTELYNTNNALVSWYYSTNGTDYKATDIKEWVVHANESVYVKLQLQITETGDHFPVVGSIYIHTKELTSAYTGLEAKYSIIGGEAYASYTCPTCGKDMGSEKLDASKYVIATPSNAQSVLDSDINGKIVIFDGTFNDVLEIRPSYGTTTVYYSGVDPTNPDPAKLVPEPYGRDNLYRYFRTVSNVTFTATENSVFNNIFAVLAQERHPASTPEKADVTGSTYDAVKGIEMTRYYFAHIKLNNITFTNMKFAGARGRITINLALQGTEAKGLTIKNCSFITTPGNYGTDAVGGSSWNDPIFINSYAFSPFEDFVFKNNVVQNHTSGLCIIGAKNVTIANNIIKDCLQSIGINLQSQTTSAHMMGEILIVNNDINGTGDRAIRFNLIKDATITIANNKFNNAVDEDGDLLKTQAVTNSTITFVNNTYAGIDMTNYKSVGDVTGNFIININN